MVARVGSHLIIGSSLILTNTEGGSPFFSLSPNVDTMMAVKSTPGFDYTRQSTIYARCPMPAAYTVGLIITTRNFGPCVVNFFNEVIKEVAC